MWIRCVALGVLSSLAVACGNVSRVNSNDAAAVSSASHDGGGPDGARDAPELDARPELDAAPVDAALPDAPISAHVTCWCGDQESLAYCVSAGCAGETDWCHQLCGASSYPTACTPDGCP